MKPTLLLLLLLAACENSSAGKSGEAAKSSPADPVLAGWKKAGLTVSAFDAADGKTYAGGDCYAGQVNGVDAVICQYATPEAAAAAQPAGQDAIAGFTGASIANGKLLLVVADRRSADPEGRTINQATLLFEGKQPKKAPEKK